MADGRKGRRIKRIPPLDEETILSWADAHFKRHGQWPTLWSGPVDDHPGETWKSISRSLSAGHRGLKTSLSLSNFLQERRGVFRRADLPPFTVEQVLAWADLHFEKHGVYPIATDGPIEGTERETWGAVNAALRNGYRGMSGKTTLAQFLNEHRGKPLPAPPPKLTEEQILEWMDEHYARTGDWPTKDSGVVQASPEDNWLTIEGDLYKGLRGLPGKTSLARLAIQHRGRVDKSLHTPLTKELIASWMQNYVSSTGKYPTRRSGAIEGAEKENWDQVNTALIKGYRGLPGHQTLVELRESLISEGTLPDLPRKRRQAKAPNLLTREMIVGWLQAHRARHGSFPSRNTGPVEDIRGETWRDIEDCLICGRRGLPGGENLRSLKNGLMPTPKPAPKWPYGYIPFGDVIDQLSIDQIVEWMQDYAAKTRRYPSKLSGHIQGTSNMSWFEVDASLVLGRRGLQGSKTLEELKQELIESGRLPRI